MEICSNNDVAWSLLIMYISLGHWSRGGLWGLSERNSTGSGTWSLIAAQFLIAVL